MNRTGERPTFAAAGQTDVGRQRASNQDCFVVLELPNAFGDGQAFLCAAVADGMGGHIGGAEASTAAIRAVEECLSTEPPRSPADVEPFLQRTFAAAEEAIEQSRRSDDTRREGGSTLTVAVASGSQLWIGHVGDTRAYLAHGGRIEQISEDDTVGGEMQRSGYAGPGAESEREMHNVLTRALGRGAERALWQPSTSTHPFPPGARLLLCSDGLYQYFDAPELLRLIADDRRSLEEICAGLIEEARNRGGSDNITAVLARGVPAAANVPQWQARLTHAPAGRAFRRSKAVPVLFVLTCALVGMAISFWFGRGLSDVRPPGNAVHLTYEEKGGQPQVRLTPGIGAPVILRWSGPAQEAGDLTIGFAIQGEQIRIINPPEGAEVTTDGKSLTPEEQSGPLKPRDGIIIRVGDGRVVELTAGGQDER